MPKPTPRKNRYFRVCVGGRAVAEITFTPEGDIVPRSVAWLADPANVSGPDREKAVAHLVKVANLDPKVDYERVFDALWSQAPKREA